MTWDALIAITEVAGLIMIVVSLVYIGIQNRQTNEHAKAATELAYFRHFGDQFDQAMNNEQDLDILRRGLQGFDALNKNEQAKFGARMFSYLRSSVLSELMSRKGLLGKAVAEESEGIWLGAVNTPGGNEFLQALADSNPDLAPWAEEIGRQAKDSLSLPIILPWLRPD